MVPFGHGTALENAIWDYIVPALFSSNMGTWCTSARRGSNLGGAGAIPVLKNDLMFSCLLFFFPNDTVTRVAKGPACKAEIQTPRVRVPPESLSLWSNEEDARCLSGRYSVRDIPEWTLQAYGLVPTGVLMIYHREDRSI